MAEAKMGLVEWLDDLSVRFLLNLPPSELSSVPRLCFQVEEAQWYYEDFVRPLTAASGNPLPSLPLRAFCLALFQHCPLLSGFTDDQHIAAYEEFLAYKVRVPVRGAILLDESMERVLLVRGWKKGASWSFPRGKINKDEKDLDCAIREVYEETGYDVGAAGLVPENSKDVKYFDITMREQHMRMFVFRGVPMETFFEPRTRKEIGKIDWYDLQSLPGFAKRNKQHGEGGNTNKFYMVAPFMNSLKKWIGQQHRKDAAVAQTEEQLQLHGLTAHQEVDEFETDAQETTPEPAAVVDRSDELMRLLSIGGASAAPTSVNPDPPVLSSGGNLLAMLQAGSAGNRQPPPQTPMEQIHAFTPVPETPQPHHLRQPSLGHQPPPPHQFPFSSVSFRGQQQQQRNLFVHAMHAQGRFDGPRYDQSGPPPHMQQHQMQQHRASLPAMMQHPQRNGSQPLPQQHSHHMQQMQHQPAFPGASQAYQNQSQSQQHPGIPIQGSQGAIAAGPSVPRASQLPPPKLNAHSMNLLDAFKSGSKPNNASPGTTGVPQPTNSHQAGLLGLFRTSSEPKVPLPPHQPSPMASASQPEMEEERKAPPPAPERRKSSTLNQFTRTLPTKFKPKRSSQPSPIMPTPVQPVQPPLANAGAGDAMAQPAQKVMPQPVQEPEQAARSRPVPITVLSREPQPPAPSPAPKVTQPQQTPRTRQASGPSIERQSASRQPKKHTPTPKTLKRSNGSSPVGPTVPFTILTRPKPNQDAGSSTQSPSLSPQPQALRRPENGAQPAEPSAANTTSHDASSENDGKRDHLLSLFTKSPRQNVLPSPGPTSPATAPPPPVSDPTSPPNTTTNQNTLLNLFQSSSKQPHPPTPTHQSNPLFPPPPPHLAPSQHPPKPKTPTPAPAPVSVPPSAPRPEQNPLLNLFKKPTTHPAGSPDSPISPFTLGSPNTRHPHQQIPSKLSVGHVGQMGQQTFAGDRSARGSFASSGRGTPTSGGVATPTEARDKEFLMGFLNGVVLKEGRGNGKSGGV